MSKRNLHLFLQDILEAIANIEEYTQQISFNEFIKDKKTIQAVVRNLEIIGIDKWIENNSQHIK